MRARARGGPERRAPPQLPAANTLHARSGSACAPARAAVRPNNPQKKKKNGGTGVVSRLHFFFFCRVRAPQWTAHSRWTGRVLCPQCLGSLYSASSSPLGGRFRAGWA